MMRLYSPESIPEMVTFRDFKDYSRTVLVRVLKANYPGLWRYTCRGKADNKLSVEYIFGTVGRDRQKALINADDCLDLLVRDRSSDEVLGLFGRVENEVVWSLEKRHLSYLAKRSLERVNNAYIAKDIFPCGKVSDRIIRTDLEFSFGTILAAQRHIMEIETVGREIYNLIWGSLTELMTDCLFKVIYIRFHEYYKDSSDRSSQELDKLLKKIGKSMGSQGVVKLMTLAINSLGKGEKCLP